MLQAIQNLFTSSNGASQHRQTHVQVHPSWSNAGTSANDTHRQSQTGFSRSSHSQSRPQDETLSHPNSLYNAPMPSTIPNSPDSNFASGGNMRFSSQGNGPSRSSALQTSESSAPHAFPPSGAYPPLSYIWGRIARWYDSEYVELRDTLAAGCDSAKLDALEDILGLSLPPCVRESYLIHDGQDIEDSSSCQDGLFFGLQLLTSDEIATEWSFWRTVDDDPSTSGNPEIQSRMSCMPPGWIKPLYSSRSWIPLITDRMGNYIGIDLGPPVHGGGSAGQVIVFGRDFDRKVVLSSGSGHNGWALFLNSFADDLEAGDWTLASSSPTGSTRSSEDSIGYNGYFGTGGEAVNAKVNFRVGGDYKGWSTIESWIDRSERRWKQLGLISTELYVISLQARTLARRLTNDKTAEP